MIVANMASFPARKDILPHSIERLLPQVDRINLCLNEYDHIPKEFAKYEKVDPFIPEKDYKDIGKFVPDVEEDDHIVLVDDDIDYPADYIETLFLNYLKYSHMESVVGVHGIIYPDLFDGNVASRKVFMYARSLERPRVVNQLGTGTVMLRGYQMPSLEYMLGSERYVDVRFSRFVYEQGYPLVCIPRDEEWIVEKKIHGSIFDTFTSNWPESVVKEVQNIAGYGKLDFDTVMEVEK